MVQISLIDETDTGTPNPFPDIPPAPIPPPPTPNPFPDIPPIPNIPSIPPDPGPVPDSEPRPA